jgi:hypothetical protein
MANLMDSRCQYLLLPRPWVKMTPEVIAECRDANRNGALYVRGDANLAGRTIRLPYWHKVVWIAQLES